MPVSVTADFQEVYKKLDSKAMDRGKYAAANQMLADMNQFIPADNYVMRSSGYVISSGEQIIWNTPYSKAQFYGTNGIAVFKNYTTPGTGSRWDLKATPLFMSSWVSVFMKGAGL